MTVVYSDLEEKSQPVFGPGATLQMAAAGPGVQAQAQMQQQRNVGTFQGVGAM